VTAYNGAAYVADAIESILAQTRPVEEIVVVDDGSTDNTAEIVESYRPFDVRCIRQENRGLSRARNRGIRETTGDLIAFLDCDDTWLPDKNALQVDYLAAHPEAAIVSGHVWWWEPLTNRRWLERLGVRRSKLRREITIHNCVGNASGTLVRRRILEEVGLFDPTQIWAEDWELWMRLASRGEIGFIERPVIVYRVVPTGLTHQRRWERVAGYFHLSFQAIEAFRPAYWRPILRLRAWSKRELGWALVSLDQRLGRRAYLQHAALAFLSYPFEQPWMKLKHFVRAVTGSTFLRGYRYLKGAIAALARRSPV
jgi:glycosyltransferase involved in cell wall biosynthesis